MLNKSIITAVFILAAIVSLATFAAVTMDGSPTDERSDRRTITDTVVKMNKTMESLLEETKKNNALMEEFLKTRK
jgi:hypothetical protein